MGFVCAGDVVWTGLRALGFGVGFCQLLFMGLETVSLRTEIPRARFSNTFFSF